VVEEPSTLRGLQRLLLRSGHAVACRDVDDQFTDSFATPPPNPCVPNPDRNNTARPGIIVSWRTVGEPPPGGIVRAVMFEELFVQATTKVPAGSRCLWWGREPGGPLCRR